MAKDPSGRDAMAHARDKLKRAREILEADPVKARMGELAMRQITAKAADRELIVELLSRPTAQIQT